MVTKHSVVSGLLTALLGCALAQRAAAQDLWQPYTLRTFDGRTLSAELARLRLPENRARPNGQTIELAVVRLKSTASTPASPIVFLSGGPGIPAASLAQVPVYFALFERLREVADVLLVDQRGIGMSTPVLNCSSTDPLPADFFTDRAIMLREFSRRTTDCIQSWHTRGVTPAAFSNEQSADDIESLRRAIGAERISLLGFSYGTLLGSIYIQRHGDRVDRTVFAGMQGPGQSLKLPSVFDDGFRQVAAFAARDSTTSAHTPDLVGMLTQVLQRLRTSPMRVTVQDRRRNAAVEVEVNDVALRALIALHLSDRRLPALVYTISQRDPTILARFVQDDYNGLPDGATNLMARALMCSAPTSTERANRVRAEAATALLGESMDNIVLSAEYCAGFGQTRAAAVAVRHDRPALFITGTLDFTTPAANAEAVMRGFSQSQHLLVENAGHETLPDPRVQQLVADFFAGRPLSALRLPGQRRPFFSVAEAKLIERLGPCGEPRC